VPFAIFDVETRIDKSLVRSVLHRHEDLSDEDAYARTREQLIARRGSDFFPVAFHVPVSIVLGLVDDARVLTDVRRLGAPYGERAVVAEFWDWLERFDGTLVSFNGRGFDLPVLELAALRHGCRIPRYFREGGHRSRHSDEAHYDLYDFLTNHGMYSVQGGFHLLARLIGLPGKGEVDGGDVQALWEAGRLADIHAYCRRDVVQTYFLFLRLEAMRGRITPDEEATALARTAAFRSELG
jgi:predicted PolB exonuclease-like 3'-5' exonuclease